MIEFPIHRYLLEENDREIVVDVRRGYGTTGSISVDYDYDPVNLDCVEMKSGTLHFQNGEDEKQIKIKIFPKNVYSTEDMVVKIVMYNP